MHAQDSGLAVLGFLFLPLSQAQQVDLEGTALEGME